MAFLTDATLAHEFGSMKDPLPSKTTMLPLSITPDTASKGLQTLAPRNVTVSFGANFYRQFSQIVELFISIAHVSLSFH